MALLLSPQQGARSQARLQLAPTGEAAQTCTAPALENLRRQIPALRALPLLQQLAAQRSGRCVLDYLPPMQLAAELTVC